MSSSSPNSISSYSPFESLPPELLPKICRFLDPHSLVALMYSYPSLRRYVAKFSLNTFWRRYVTRLGIRAHSTLLDDTGGFSSDTVADRIVARERNMNENKCFISKVDLHSLERKPYVIETPASGKNHKSLVVKKRINHHPALRESFSTSYVDSRGHLTMWNTTTKPPTKLDLFSTYMDETENMIVWQHFLITVPLIREVPANKELTILKIYNVNERRTVGEVKVPFTDDIKLCSLTHSHQVPHLLQTPMGKVKVIVRSAHLPGTIFVCSVPGGILEHKIILPDSLEFVDSNFALSDSSKDRLIIHDVTVSCSKVLGTGESSSYRDYHPPSSWLTVATRDNAKPKGTTTVLANLVALQEDDKYTRQVQSNQDGTTLIVVSVRRARQEWNRDFLVLSLVHQTLKEVAPVNESVALEAETALEERVNIQLEQPLVNLCDELNDLQVLRRGDVTVLLLVCSIGNADVSRRRRLLIGIQYTASTKTLQQSFMVSFRDDARICPVDHGLRFAMVMRTQNHDGRSKQRQRDSMLGSLKRLALRSFHGDDYDTWTLSIVEVGSGSLRPERSIKVLKDPDMRFEGVDNLYARDGVIFMDAKSGPQHSLYFVQY